MAKIGYLTIDDAPSSDFKRKVDFLYSKSIPAIFFCVGKKLKENTEDILYAIKKGFVIGNHSWSHKDFNKLSKVEIKREIIKTDKLIDKLYKKSIIERQIKLFRFPFLKKGGLNKDFTQVVLKDLGYKQPKFENINYEWYKKSCLDKDLDVACSYNAMDWTVADETHLFGIKTLQDLLDRMDEDLPESRRGLNYDKSNEIIMLHDDFKIKEMFQPLIRKLLEKGIIFKLPNFG